MAEQVTQIRYRAIWLSDIHLGFKDCKAEFLLDFLRSTESEYLFLVGDIVDLWAMRRNVHWPDTHNLVVHCILEKARRGVKVIYIPGNHDRNIRDFCGHKFADVEIHRDYIHETAAGVKLLLLHGDEFDAEVKLSPINKWVGDIAYDFLLFLNRWTHRFRRRLGYPYWSLASYLKTKVKNAADAIATFERAAVREAQRRGVDGVVCGHIHHAELSTIDGTLYCNDGDWIENCTAMVETPAGDLHILHWGDQIQLRKRHNAAANDEDICMEQKIS